MVDDHKVAAAAEVVDKAGGRVDHEARTAHDEHVGERDLVKRLGHHIVIKRLAVEHDVGLDGAAALGAHGYAVAILVFAGHDPLGGVDMTAALADVAVHRAVELEHVHGAGGLVEAIDVLRHHGSELAFALELGELEVSLVRLGVKRDHLRAIELVELCRVGLVEVVGEHRLGRISELLVIQAIHAAEIRNAACGGDAGAAKEHDALGTLDAPRELLGRLDGISDGLGHGSSIRRAAPADRLQNGANYNLPIFHRYDYSIPIENSVPGDKGKPMFLMDVLKEDESDFYTDEYKYKTLIIDFLKE